VAHLLEGSVQRSGDIVRVSAELVDTADGAMQWSENYDRPYKEVYALRNDANSTVQWLDRASSSRDPRISYLLYDPFIRRSKNDPRYAAFCRKVGLPVPGE
jgi:hypothetical protein